MINEFRTETAMSSRGPLAVDYLVLAYLAATGIVALTSLTGMGLGLAALHAAGMGLVWWMASLPLPSHGLVLFFRMFYPVALTPLLYLELAPLNQVHVTGYFDATVMQWEELLFGTQLATVFSEWYGRLWFSEMLHLGYFSYYFIVPGAAATAYLLKGPRALERASFTIALAFFICYLCFSVFPVAGPRYDFPQIAGEAADGVAPSAPGGGRGGPDSGGACGGLPAHGRSRRWQDVRSGSHHTRVGFFQGNGVPFVPRRGHAVRVVRHGTREQARLLDHGALRGVSSAWNGIRTVSLWDRRPGRTHRGDRGLPCDAVADAAPRRRCLGNRSTPLPVQVLTTMQSEANV